MSASLQRSSKPDEREDITGTPNCYKHRVHERFRSRSLVWRPSWSSVTLGLLKQPRLYSKSANDQPSKGQVLHTQLAPQHLNPRLRRGLRTHGASPRTKCPAYHIPPVRRSANWARWIYQQPSQRDNSVLSCSFAPPS